MKLFHSIKWRLQLWYGLMLLVVLVGFGVTAFQLERNRQFRRIDEELHRRVNVVRPCQRAINFGGLPAADNINDLCGWHGLVNRVSWLMAFRSRCEIITNLPQPRQSLKVR